MSERNGFHASNQIDIPAVDRSEAIESIASGMDLGKVADIAGVDLDTIREWANRDPEFIASVNRVKRDRLNQLRAEVSSLATDALGVIREMIRSEGVPAAIRLKACCVILEAAEALKPVPIGATSEKGVRARLYRQDLAESLGG